MTKPQAIQLDTLRDRDRFGGKGFGLDDVLLSIEESVASGDSVSVAAA